jgi:hypothetical protein
MARQRKSVDTGAAARQGAHWVARQIVQSPSRFKVGDKVTTRKGVVTTIQSITPLGMYELDGIKGCFGSIDIRKAPD